MLDLRCAVLARSFACASDGNDCGTREFWTEWYAAAHPFQVTCLLWSSESAYSDAETDLWPEFRRYVIALTYISNFPPWNWIWLAHHYIDMSDVILQTPSVVQTGIGIIILKIESTFLSIPLYSNFSKTNTSTVNIHCLTIVFQKLIC